MKVISSVECQEYQPITIAVTLENQWEFDVAIDIADHLFVDHLDTIMGTKGYSERVDKERFNDCVTQIFEHLEAHRRPGAQA